MSHNLFWPPFLDWIIFSNFISNMCSCSTLSKILQKNSFGKVVFQILVTWLFRETKIRFLAAMSKLNIFWSCFLLIYDCFGCIHILCKFYTEILMEKYSKMNGSKWPPPRAQTGVKSSLRTWVLKRNFLICLLQMHLRWNSFNFSLPKIRKIWYSLRSGFNSVDQIANTLKTFDTLFDEKHSRWFISG